MPYVYCAVFPAVRIVSSKKEKPVYTDAVITLSLRPNPLCTAFWLKLPYGVDYHLHLGHHLEYDNGKSVKRFRVVSRLRYLIGRENESDLLGT